jgi:hypothetical protein
MASERSRQKLLEFLDYLAEKGLMAQATASARKAAANRLLGVLSEEEANDVTALDLDDVMARFHNLEGKRFTPGSLTTYLSRVKSAVDDFRTYLENPLGFRPSVQVRDKRKSEGKNNNGPATTTTDKRSSVERAVVKVPLASSVLPIPIRPEITIYVQGLPYDLTEAEANKIANVIKAMSTPA